jgi:hypothetical protein
MITYLLVQAAPNLFDVLNHIERSSHAAYLEAKKKISSGSKLKSPTSTTTTTTTTPGHIFSDVPEKFRTILLHYSLRHIMRCNQDESIPNMHKMDWKKSVSVSCTHGGNSPHSFDPSSGGPSSVPITAVRVGSVYSEGCRASAVGIVALSDESLAAKFTPMYESCKASNGKAQPVGCRYHRSLIHRCHFAHNRAL